MSSEFLNSNHLAWSSFASSNRGSEANDDDYPLLFQLLDFLLDNYTTNKEDRSIDVLASGKLLCEHTMDYFSDIELSGFHSDAKPYSSQADDNLAAFANACEKIGIPRSCIATSKDYSTRNLAKIELMLVMFVIRGMAWSPSFPRVKDEDIMNSLKEYKLQKYPELSRDRKICEKILEVLRDHDNDKSIPLQETISDGSISSDDISSDEEPQKDSLMPENSMPVETEQEEKQVNDGSGSLRESEMISESSDEENQSFDVDEVRDDKVNQGDEVDEADKNVTDKKVLDDDNVDEVDSDKVRPLSTEAGDAKEDDSVDEANQNKDDSVDEVNQNKEDSVDEVNQDEDRVDEADNDETKLVNPSASVKDEDDGNLPEQASDAGSEPLPNDTEPENVPIKDSDTETTDPEDNVPEVDSDSSGPSGPTDDGIPSDDDIIMRSNDPAGCDVNHIETAEEIEERKRKKREAKRKAKMEALPGQSSMEPREVTIQPMANAMKLQTPMKREVKWYIVTLIVLLMILCLAGIITCAVWLAKLN